MNRILIFTLSLLLTQLAAHAQLSVTENGNTVTLQNNLAAFSFNTTNADLTSIVNHKGVSLLGKKGRGYLLGPGFSMSPTTYSLVRKTDSLIEIAFDHEADNHFHYSLHYIIRPGVSGVYCYLTQSHKAGDSAGIYGQTRWGISANESLFNYHLVRDSIQGPMPAMSSFSDANKIQDWTYRLPDGTVYTKYNYADYIEDRYVHGMAGTASNLGLFVIQASHEYLNGGPTKQYQNVHSTPYLICMFNCGHFLSDKRKSDDVITGDWQKTDGPFLLYTNEGSDINAIWTNAKQQAQQEIAQWPYQWMQTPDYPLQRGTVTGTLLLNNQPAANTHMILAAPGYDWQAQTSGYIYAVRTDAKGFFTIPHVRAGSYTLYAYGANQTASFSKANITVSANKTTAIGVLAWQPANHGKILWQLGIADRTTRGFRFSDHPREYGIFDQVPDSLHFTIGQSKEATDWYYAQTKPGNWYIHFTSNTSYTKPALLTIAIAGAAKNPTLQVLVNGQTVKTYKPGNDASVYRSAVAGGYYQLLEIPFDGSLLQKGNNIITLQLPDVKNGGGIMYDAIKLEAE
ncbi:polysaccharide lyase family protein [Filimonas lacunae]|nr:polysaccharide lyase family protein [Filimonas lacunae]